MKTIAAEELLGYLAGIADGERRLVAIAGPPGSGKSTLAAGLELALNGKLPGYAAVFAMDGFHFDDGVLVQRGLRDRKGAPETFDVDGFVHMLARLRSNDADEVAVPVFDRSLEIARAGARVIPRSVRAVIVEGNYLLLDQDRWNQLSFDTSVMIEVPRATLRRRLVGRWLEHGKTAPEIAAQVDLNDMVNVDLVQRSRRVADFQIEQI